MQSYGKGSGYQMQGGYQGYQAQSGYGQSQMGMQNQGYGQSQGMRPMQNQGMQNQGMQNQGMQNQGMWGGQGKGDNWNMQGDNWNMQGGQQKGFNNPYAQQQKGCPGQPQKGMQQKGGMQAMQQQQQQQAQQQKGPPKREMDSLLEEMKARQRMQEQNKEMLKQAEERAAAAAAAAAEIAESHGGGMTGGAYNQQYGAAKAPMSGGAYASQYGNSGGYNNSQFNSMNSSMNSTKNDDYSDRPSRPSGGVARPAFLYLKEFPSSMNEDAVCKLFSRYGIVTGVNILRGQEGQQISRGYVTMDTQDSASRAKDALHDRDVDGVPLWIESARGPPGMSECDFAETSDATDGCRRIVVRPPTDRKRRRVIDLMAKYVSQEGHQFEMVIMEREPQDGNHPDFSFLYEHDSPDNRYYRWRVFAFAQGDNYNAWRTQPYRMHDNGSAWWQPPFCEVSREAQLNRKTNFSAGPGGTNSLTADTTGSSTPDAKPEAKPEARVEEVEEVKPTPVSAVAKYPAGWTELDILDEKERTRLEEKATQERQRRDRDKKGIAGGKRLTDSDWDRLEQLLRSVKTARAGILEAMVFCLDKSDCAIEITECITESLTIVETDMSIKLARLMLVSDVLHNTCSTKPAAWAYRREFERSLPDIMESLFLSLDRMDSKLDVERYRESVMKVLRVWEDWGLFAPQYTRGLEAAVFVGVKNLRSLRSKGDTSREPPWMDLKLNEWRRQHFSQLEKMCRTRGLRCSTAHLEATRNASLEDNRREWLVDRLVCYELHWHEKEQAREKDKNAGRSKQISAEDIDGESIECDIDGFPLAEGDLDGEAVDLGDIDTIVDIMELTRIIPETNLARCSPEMLRYGGSGGEDPMTPPIDEPDSAETHPEEDSPPFEDMLDIERPEDARRSDIAADHRTSGTRERKEIDDDVLRDIELEVMELRASLETQGLFKDAIQDICDEKRRNLIKEQEAILASPMNTGGMQTTKSSAQGRHAEDRSDSDSEDGQRQREKEREKERGKHRREEEEKKDREKEKDKEKSKKDKSKKKDKDKEKEKEKESTRKEKRSESQPRADRGRDKHRSRSREKDKEKDRGSKKRVSRSRSRDQAKKKMRR